MILITGGMGFIGLSTARQFLDVGEGVVLTYHRSWRLPDFLENDIGERLAVEKTDITNLHDLLAIGRKHDITGIVHMAVPGVGAAAVGPVEEYRISTLGLLNVLEAAQEWGAKRVTLASSGAMYAGVPEGPFREDMLLPVQSRSGTEAYKKTWENLGTYMGSQMELDVVAMRISGIYGPMFWHPAPAMPMRIVMAACQSAIRGEPAEFADVPNGPPFAEAWSDLCYVKDIATGIQLLQTADELQHNVYNLSSGRATTLGEVAEAIKQVIPSAKTTLQSGRPPVWKPSPYMDLTRIREDVGYEPEYDIKSGVTDYIDWLREHPE